VRKLHEPPPLDKRTLFDRHIAELKASGLTEETIRAAGIYSEERPHALTEICGRTYSSQQGASIVFPFHLPGAVRPYAFRIKPDRPRLGKPNRNGKRKPIKYDQSSDTGLIVYLPPWTRESGALQDSAQPLYFTEGEKKSLALDQLRLPCVGLTGVFAYKDVGIEAPANDAPERLHKTVREHATIAGRVCVICFDADARENAQVMLAAGRAAGVLVAAGALEVKFIVPPSLQHKGIDDFYAAHGEEATRALLDSAQPIEPISPREPLARIKSIKSMRDAPISNELRLPLGYTIENDGVLWKVGQDDKHSDAQVARGPILIQRYLNDYYSREERADITFKCDGRWESVCVERKAIVDSRTMVSQLSLYGAPVTSSNAGRLVDWIDELERVNTERVERIACVSNTGWHTIDDVRLFVANEPLFADETTVPLALDTRGPRKRMFAALKPGKDAEAHRDALCAAWNADPICAAMIAGALAATLLEPLNSANFAIHLPGDSSRGKTTILKIAASVFGDPNNEMWLASWNTTQVAAELRAATFSDLPLCFDEVGAAGDRVGVERMIYMLINGVGRARGHKEMNMRESLSWRTIVLSTGERGLADERAATGAQVRVLQLPVRGIGTLGAGEVDALREACCANAGAFGRAWLNELLAVQDWSYFQSMFADYRDILRTKATNNLQQRTASYWALLCVAEVMSYQLGLGQPSAKTILGLFDQLAKSEQIRPASERARQHVEEWTSIESRAFPTLRPSTDGKGDDSERSNAPQVHGYVRDDGAIIFWPTQLRARLEANGFDYEQVCRDWFSRGWIEPSHDGRSWQRVCTINGKATRMVILLPEHSPVQPC
jgi:hypothetical protein